MIDRGLELRVGHSGHAAVRIERDDEKRCNALGSTFFADDEIAGHRVIGRHILSPLRSRRFYYRPRGPLRIGPLEPTAVVWTMCEDSPTTDGAVVDVFRTSKR